MRFRRVPARTGPYSGIPAAGVILTSILGGCVRVSDHAPGPAVPVGIAAAFSAVFACSLAVGVYFYIRLHRLHARLRNREAELVGLSDRLRKQAEHLRQVIDTVPAYIYAKDDSGHFILVNRLFARVFGVEPEEVVGRTNQDYGETPEETARFMAEDREILRTGKTLFVPEERAPRPDGSPGWFQTTKIPYRLPDRETPAILGVSIDITERHEQGEAMRRMAQHDPLTGLANRALFSELLGKALAVTRREKNKLALLFIDLDAFKPVNDNFGHAAGDIVLKETARRIEGALRESDGAGRIGGDEFVAFVLGLKEAEDGNAVARKVREAIRAPIDVGDAVLEITASVGCAIFPEDGADQETLLAKADYAMYQEKQARNLKGSTEAPGSKSECPPGPARLRS